MFPQFSLPFNRKQNTLRVFGDPKRLSENWTKKKKSGKLSG
jgi:hypothetical protein